MRFSILGQTGIRVDGRFDRQWGPLKQRAVLAVLLAQPRTFISRNDLVDWVWGQDEPPRNVGQTLYLYSSRIRRAIEIFPDVELLTEPGGFRLEVDPQSIDYFCFQQLVRGARMYGRRGDHQRSLDMLNGALALWRSVPLADLNSDAAELWRQRKRANVLMPAYNSLFVELLELGEPDVVLTTLDELAVNLRIHRALFKRKLEALHALARSDEATEQFLLVHKELSDDFDDVGARDLREFYERLKENSHQPAATPVTGGVLVPMQLPQDVEGFVGRQDLLLKLDAVTTRPGLVVVDGTGGVGKTAFVVHWAHTALERFPDGVLYVDMQGFSDAPLIDASGVVDRFLEGLGVAADRIPLPEHRAARLQSLLANRNMLVVLDNARDTDHVSPVLALCSSALVVVTSRSRLSGLAVRHKPYRFPIATMDQELSAKLLAEHIDDRASDDHALAGLARLCGGLPIALKMLAQYVTSHTGVPLGDFVVPLSTDIRLLDLGAIGDTANHRPRAVFAQSVSALEPDVHRLFRLLAVHPGADFGVGVAAALADLPPRHTRLALDALVEAHLLEPSTEFGRYRFHDLIREFAADLIGDADDRRSAERRMLGFYLATAENADTAVFPTAARARVPHVSGRGAAISFSNDEEARQWCTLERRNLIAVARFAHETGYEEQIAPLPQLVGQILLRYGSSEEVLTLLHLGLTAAIACGDVEGEADSHHNIAMVHMLRQEFGLAEQHVHEANKKYFQIGDDIGIASCLHTGARIMVATGNVLIGIESHRRALSLMQRVGPPGLQIPCLYRLGEALQCGHEYEQAASAYREALALARESGDIAAQGRVLTLLGSLCLAREHAAEARDHLLAGLRLLELAFDVGTAGTAFGLLARVGVETGSLVEAKHSARQSARLCRRAADLRGEADALSLLGEIFRATACYDGALEAFEAAQSIYQSIDPERARKMADALHEVRAVVISMPAARDGSSTVSPVDERNAR